MRGHDLISLATIAGDLALLGDRWNEDVNL
jgi:hypothetical protein